MDDPNLEVENVLLTLDKKKKINSKKKGNRVELALTKILQDRFGKSFSRSVGSGNRWGQVANMPTHAKTTLTGDICPPEGFLWVIECKGGYENTTDLNTILANKNKTFDSFIEQSLHDVKESKRLPLIVWKRDRKPWVAMFQEKDAPDLQKFETRLHYGEWVAVSLEELLKITPDNFWFREYNDHIS